MFIKYRWSNDKVLRRPIRGRVNTPLTYERETRAFPREIRMRFPVRGPLVDISISLHVSANPCQSVRAFPILRCLPLSVASHSRCCSYDNFPRWIFLLQLCNVASSSSPFLLLVEYLFLPIVSRYNRDHFPVPSPVSCNNNAELDRMIEYSIIGIVVRYEILS